MVLNLPLVPVSFSRNRVQKDSASFGLIKEFRAPDGDPLRDMSAHEPNDDSLARKPSTLCEMSDLDFRMRCAFPILHPRC